jgi:hypothetical protein
MRRMKSLSLILIVLCVPLFGSSQTGETLDTSGNAFVRLCSAIEKEDTTNSDINHLMACIGYVSGFVSGVDFGAGFAEDQAGKKVRRPFCRPVEVENGQLIRVVLKYVRDNPEKAHQPTSWLLMNAFGKAFPCK